MEENRFEKQVKDKMEELSFLPSDTVWKNIKEGIKEKKRSRWGILILFFILAAGSYIGWNAAQKKLLKKSAHIEKNFSSKISLKNNSMHPANSTSGKNSIYLKNKMERNSVGVGIATVYKGKTASNQPLKNTKYIFIKNQSADKLKTTIELSGQQQNEINESGQVHQTPPTSTSTKQQEIFSEENENNTKAFADSTLNNEVKKIAINTTDTSLRKSITLKKKNATSKWTVGLNITPGISSVSNSILNSGSNNAAYSVSLPTSVNGQGNTTRIYNSSNRPGFGFIAGVIAERKITKKTTLSAGINYASFSIKNISADSILGYAARELNYFNYIQFPVLLKIQINKSKKIPLYFQGGITLSKPLNTGIAANKLYYHNIQAGINGAVSFGLLPMQKHQLLIGPFYYYNAGKIADEALYNQKHISFVGLRAEFIL